MENDNPNQQLQSKAPPILLWHFDDAPEVLRKMSPHGGDEDFLAFVPETFARLPEESGDADVTYFGVPFDRGMFGCCSISSKTCEFAGQRGSVVIGAHA